MDARIGQNKFRRAGQKILLAAIAMFSATPVATGSADELTPFTQSQIAALEKDFNAAYAHNDLPRYFSYYAEDFRGLFPDGISTKLAYVKSWSAYIKGGSKIVSFTWSDMVITASPSGDAAVASYHAIANTKEPGKPQKAEKYDETDVWFKRNGKFELVEVHYSDMGHVP